MTIKQGNSCKMPGKVHSCIVNAQKVLALITIMITFIIAYNIVIYNCIMQYNNRDTVLYVSVIIIL